MCVHFPCVNLETPGRHLQVLKCVNFACWNPISDLLGALVRWQEERKKEVRRKKDLSRGSIRLSQSPLEFCSQIIDQALRCYTQQMYHCPQSVFNGIPWPHSLSRVFPGCFFAVPVHFLRSSVANSLFLHALLLYCPGSIDGKNDNCDGSVSP